MSSSRRCRGLAPLVVALLLAAPAAAADIEAQYHLSDDTLLSIGEFTFEGGKTLKLTVGIGSAAWRGPNDPANVLWTVGDRGPNIACSEIRRFRASISRLAERPRLPDTKLRAADQSGDVARRGSFRVTDVITLMDRDGHSLSFRGAPKSWCCAGPALTAANWQSCKRDMARAQPCRPFELVRQICAPRMIAAATRADRYGNGTLRPIAQRVYSRKCAKHKNIDVP